MISHASHHGDAAAAAAAAAAGVAGDVREFGRAGRLLAAACKAAAIAGTLVFVALVVMSIVSISGRKIASMPVPGDVEMLQLCAAFASSSFFAWCHLNQGDVKVDFFTEWLPASTVHTLNQARYDGLAPDLKKVIDANSGAAVSAWAGERGFDAVVVANHKLASDRGNAIVALGDAEYQRWIKASADVDDQWVKEVSAKGANGKALLEEARALIQQYDR